MAPLPPRPPKPTPEVEIPIDDYDDEMLPEKTRLERQGGREAVRLAQARLHGEIAEGKRLVERAQKLAERKLTIDSEQGEE
jgi:hypothetical protein